MKVYITCGTAGSGKTTAINNLKKDSDIVISKDNIRKILLQEGEDYFSHEKEVVQKFNEQIDQAILGNQDIFIDGVNLTKRSRRKILRRINRKDIEIIALYINVPLELALIQNSKRTGRAFVDEDAILFHYNLLIPPSFDEGFDTIIEIKRGEF